LKDLGRGGNVSLADLISFSVKATLERISPIAVFVPTRSGYTARSIARFQVAGLDRGRQFPGKHVSEASILLWGLPGS